MQTYATTAESEACDMGLLYGAACVADAIAPLFRSLVSGRGEVVGGSGLGVDGGHLEED